MNKRIKVTGIVCILGVTLVTAFYAKGAILSGKTVENNPSQPVVQEPLQQLPEPAPVILPQDNRPLKKEAVKVKGIYMSGVIFNYPKYFQNLVNLVDRTELNALVIDVKDDDGFLSVPVNIPVAQEIKTRVHKGGNAEENIKQLTEKEIYPIARIVVFKDPSLAEGKPELALKKKSGGIWRDRKGLAWVDPHNKDVWKYAVDVAKEAAKLGFREIQFDYVRFPTDGDVENAVYPYANGKAKEDIILEFLTYAKTELESYNVFLAADVFGLTTLTLDDMGMGQKYEKVITQVDYICPMVYPSHYGPGNYGFKNPNAYPYEIVKRSLLDAQKKSATVENTSIIRPWLQDFNLGSPKYGPEQVRAQIKGTYDAGLEEWILWNAGNRYTEEALLKVN